MADADTCGRVGVLGAASFVGRCLLPLLTEVGSKVTAFSRHPARQAPFESVTWQQLPLAESDLASAQGDGQSEALPHWICVAPIWVLPDYFGSLQAHGARRVVVLSSTSRFTKDDSSDPEEQATVQRLTGAEAQLQAWAEHLGVEWVILRPTLIYDLGQDKNVSEIARFIRRFGFFPVFGKAQGLRQPVHARDVAAACVAALQAPGAVNRAFNISGGETLPYREMVARIFAAMGRRPQLLTVPLWLFRLAIAVVRLVPRYRHWSVAMAVRMNRDLVFDHADATRDFGYAPRGFTLTVDDLPASNAGP